MFRRLNNQMFESIMARIRLTEDWINIANNIKKVREGIEVTELTVRLTKDQKQDAIPIQDRRIMPRKSLKRNDGNLTRNEFILKTEAREDELRSRKSPHTREIWEQIKKKPGRRQAENMESYGKIHATQDNRGVRAPIESL